jgi:hypothetical protein
MARFNRPPGCSLSLAGLWKLPHTHLKYATPPNPSSTNYYTRRSSRYRFVFFSGSVETPVLINNSPRASGNRPKSFTLCLPIRFSLAHHTRRESEANATRMASVLVLSRCPLLLLFLLATDSQALNVGNLLGTPPAVRTRGRRAESEFSEVVFEQPMD